MSSTHRTAVSRVVEGQPSEVFRIVTDPNMHVEIDGSGMLQAARDSRPLRAVGDTFEMDMDREPLGDIPMGKYKVLNTVTRIVPDTLIEWSVGTKEQSKYGHVYGWEIKAISPNTTEITNYCDWTDIPEDWRHRFPVVPTAMIEKSVENLAALIEKQAKA